jgi:hypothetical protein
LYFRAISEKLLQTLNKIDLDLIAMDVLLTLDAPSKLYEPGLEVVNSIQKAGIGRSNSRSRRSRLTPRKGMYSGWRMWSLFIVK